MSFKKSVALNLAAAFLAGAWSAKALIRRGAEATGDRGRWLSRLVRRMLAVYGEEPPRVRHEDLAEFINSNRHFDDAFESYGGEDISISRVFWPKLSMLPSPGPPSSWSVPYLTTTTQLANWLNCSPSQLDWYSGRFVLRSGGSEKQYPRYTYAWLRKRSRDWRLLEKPIFVLKQMQRRVLREILYCVPAHEAVHSYQPGRSLLGYVQSHIGKRVVIRMDLRDFFPSIRASRIHALFETLGYPRSVARALTGLCTNAAPLSTFDSLPLESYHVAERRRLQQTYHHPHLPQGAPTSPMLSNLCTFRLDVRLSALAKSLQADYTRYADDLAFSGGRELERAYRRFHVAVCCIALEEGFEINTRKTRVMRQGVRQHLGGLVLNSHPNIARKEYDRLKAILHNCIIHGPQSQNRSQEKDYRASLTGRVQYVVMINPEKGSKLEQMMELIRW